MPGDILTAEQSTYNALLFSVACKYRFMKLDDAFRYGFAMPESVFYFSAAEI